MKYGINKIIYIDRAREGGIEERERERERERGGNSFHYHCKEIDKTPTPIMPRTPKVGKSIHDYLIMTS